MTRTILVADDHAALAEALSLALRRWHRVLSPVTTLRLLPDVIGIAQPDVVFLDLSFGTESALPLLPELIGRSRATRYIVFTNHEEKVFATASHTCRCARISHQDGGP